MPATCCSFEFDENKRFYFSKAQALVGSEDFNRIYSYLHDQREKQSEDATRTDDALRAGLETLCSNSYACQLINELVLLDCVDDLCERTQTSWKSLLFESFLVFLE